jgi:hypothetical protein
MQRGREIVKNPASLVCPAASEVVQAEIQRVKFGRHCNKNPIYVFLSWELRGLSPNFHIHVSVSDLYIPRIGPHIFLQHKRQIDHGNI